MALLPCPDCGRQVSTEAASCPQCNRPIAARYSTTGAAAPVAETVVWESVPSLRAMLADITSTLLGAVVLAVVAVWLFDPALSLFAGIGREQTRLVAANRADIKLAVTVLVVLVVAFRVAKLGWRIAVLRSHHYRVSNQRIVIETGVLSKRIDEVDMRAVEDIEFRQKFLQRLLGIGEIAIVGSDKDLGRFRLLGVENPREVRELIRANAFQATRGQLFTRST
jgi:uncharacterized membrane protein YdbT with pleckstrin-like domain